MAERFRITDRHGCDVYLEDAPSDAEIVVTVDPPDAPLPANAYLNMEQAIVLRDALDAFIDGRFDDFLRRPPRDDE
ncbi:hypothetical protein [Nocardia asiatica]|uniref:hypothetical protein n=1 Tax=Nocardia asiatica TaxID=209252 RepID=UPI00245818A0|nr:hypothetical protein [Nocardia asiatica]